MTLRRTVPQMTKKKWSTHGRVTRRNRAANCRTDGRGRTAEEEMVQQRTVDENDGDVTVAENAKNGARGLLVAAIMTIAASIQGNGG